MNLLWWRKGRKHEVETIFTKEFYENQMKERAKKIIESPTREEAEKIIEQFKLSHPGEWIENDNPRDFKPDGHFQDRPLMPEDNGKYFLGTVTDGSYVIRQIQRVIYTCNYGFIPCPTKDRVDLDVLSYSEKLARIVEELRKDSDMQKKD